MDLKLTSLQIQEMIDDIKSSKPYSKEEQKRIPLDATVENCSFYSASRVMSTQAKRILDKYFKLHPEEDVYGYLDGNCFK